MWWIPSSFMALTYQKIVVESSNVETQVVLTAMAASVRLAGG
jgi:hypothetical protein